MTTFTVTALGERAWVVSAPLPATLAQQARIWSLADSVERWPGVIETVPGMNNLTVIFDPLAPTAPSLQARLAQACESARARRPRARVVEIPVTYGGAGGPDLDAVAHHAGISAAEVIRRHTACTYVVYFVGFQPGFAYLAGLDPGLATPRRATPRVAVPAGSVGIGGVQTGVYPRSTPGGWQLIGMTELVLFDAARLPPALLAPGDKVRFRDVQGPGAPKRRAAAP